MRAAFFLPLLLLAAPLAVGCDHGEHESSAADVVIYTSIDEPVARQIIQAFEAESGYAVRVVTDTEATKSVGLAERLRAEQDRPQADVWWGNEPFYTIGLARDGVLAPYASPAAADIPPHFKDSSDLWAGNGLRARVIAVSADAGARIQSLEDLADPALRGRVAMARPTAGTTGSHVAALYVLWGQEKADAFFRALRNNEVTLVGSNSQSAQQVGAGNYWFGLTDNDDVANAAAAGMTLSQVIPDQEVDQPGTLTIPTTVGLVAGRPGNEAARKLIDFLLSAETERRLAEAQFTAYSVRPVEGDLAIKSMKVDYAEVAQRLSAAIERATALLEGREAPVD